VPAPAAVSTTSRARKASYRRFARANLRRLQDGEHLMADSFDVVIVGGGIAGSALATVLALEGIAVAVLKRDLVPIDRVRGEFMAPWGVAELKQLGLLDCLSSAGGLFVKRSIPYDENQPGEAALPLTLDLSKIHPDAPGPFCMGHPAMCAVLANEAERAGAIYFRDVEDIEVEAGTPPRVTFHQDGKTTEWRPRVVVGADGRSSRVRRQLGMTVLADSPHNLLGGMLVEGVPDWPQDLQVIGTEDRTHFLIFPQGGDKIRLYLLRFREQGAVCWATSAGKPNRYFCRHALPSLRRKHREGSTDRPLQLVFERRSLGRGPNCARRGPDRRCGWPQRSDYRARAFDCRARRSPGG
jgi:2-polyprenyl-6-methoxyphenol hydroxylase-like FAD-dependent oxidoreductase